MPQLSPMSWVMVFFIFLVSWVLIMSIFWWVARGEYKVMATKGVGVGRVVSKGLSWGFGKGLKASK
uniref:ATP synthase F0 subunit 8 n=1 Tax=Sinosolenaia oleivora TaxID=3237505 RepID=U3N1V9_9BIVA|nr:ATP synthase F0 subunit 8 [Solenaia oleivora]AGW24346.1 ATP synthase F0 subunit 8 [Solenaia oleivora]